MATHHQDLVTDVTILLAVVVEVVDPSGEALPLFLGSIGVELAICGILAVDEAKVVIDLAPS